MTAVPRPSQLHRVMQCPGSHRATAPACASTAPQTAADEGTAAHWWLTETAAGRTPGPVAPNGVAITAEMRECAADALAIIDADLPGRAGLAVETPVRIPAIHPDCAGTPDFHAWIPAYARPQGRALLHVWDYKFGRRPVHAIDNPQLAAYASGCMSATRLHDGEFDVALTIIQPRSSDGVTHRWWQGPATTIRGTINAARNAVEEAIGEGRPRLRTGPECRDCHARATCGALRDAAGSAVDIAMELALHSVIPEEISSELSVLQVAADRLKARMIALQEQATRLLSSGERVPGWMLAPSRAGNRQWRGTPAEVAALGVAFGSDLADVGVVSPAEAERRGMPRAVVDSLTTRAPGGMTLQKDDGRRAKEIFSC